MRHLILGLCLLFSLSIAGCDDGSSNHAPLANAGPDQNIATGSLVTLDGSASSDADGDALSYDWDLVSAPEGSTAVLTDSAAVRPTFTADLDGSYSFALIVNDGRIASAPDNVTVTAATANSAPVADAGANQNVATGSLVALDGSASSDADSDPLSYAWSLVSAPAGSAAVLSDPMAAAPRFTADVNGDYVVQLTVNDGTVASAPDSVIITAATANSAPVANAGANQNVITGSLVALDGSASSDADSDPLSYAWSLVSAPAGSTAGLTGSTTPTPSFTADVDGDYVVQLIVNDGTVSSAPDSVIISSSPLWSPVEQIVNADAIAEIDFYLGYPVPVRFDADTIHLYFAGYAFKFVAVVPAAIYRITSTDNGATWSLPERMVQLEGNYQNYPAAFDNGKLLLIWHDGSHSELYHTQIASPTELPAAPTNYVAYSSIGKEVIWTSHWNNSLVGMWHSTAASDLSPFIGTIGPATASLSGIAWPFDGTFYYPTPIAADTALVLTSNGLVRAGFDGSSFTAPSEPLPFPEADSTLAYGGTTFHNAALDQASGYLYFTGYNQGGSRSAIYRVRLLR